jgi:predicted MFS family arabinose efflux permease
VREDPPSAPKEPLDWEPFGRLLAMTLVFLIVILGLGEIVKVGGKLLPATTPLSTQLVVMGVLGVLSMTAAVVAGVWVSVRISVGQAEARRNPSFAWWVVNRLAFLIGVNNLFTFAVYFLQARLGLEGETAAGPASQLMMIAGILILLCAWPSGWIADRIGRKRLVALSGVLAALGTGVLLLAPNMVTIYIGGCIVGAATGIFFTTNWALGTDLVPKQAAGRYLGISNLAGAGAGAVGAYIGGPIADYFTVQVPQSPDLGYVLIFAIYAVLFLISAIVLSFVQETWKPVAK